MSSLLRVRFWLLLLIILSSVGNAYAQTVGPSPPLKLSWLAESDDPEGSFTTWPVIFGRTVYAVSGSGVLAVASDGKKLWWRGTNGAKQVFPSVDGTGIYLPVSNERLLKLDLSTGDTIWEASLPRSAESSARLSNGRLYVGIEGAKSLVSIDASTGQTLWSKQLDVRPDSVPVATSETVVFSTEEIGSLRAGILALDTENGATRWRVEQREGLSSPTLDGETVVIGGGDFYAYRLDLKTGFLIWRSRVEGKFGPRNMPAIAEGDVFLADRIGNIYRLDGKTGRRKWIFSDTEGTLDQSFPVVAGKTLYIGSAAGWLYGVNIDTGKLVWKDRVKGIVLSGAADAERFYFGVKFGDEGLYAYEHDPSGKLLQPERVPGVLRSLVGGLVLFVLLFAGVAFFVRRSRAKSS